MSLAAGNDPAAHAGGMCKVISSRGECERGSGSEALLETKVPNLLHDAGKLLHILIPFSVLCLCMLLGYLARVYARLSLNIYVNVNIYEMAQEFKYAHVRIGPEIEISAELGISIAVLILCLALCVACVSKQEIRITKMYIKR